MLRTSTTTAADIDGVIVHMSGTAGMSEAAQLSMLLTAVLAGQPRRVVFDIGGLDMLTSICIGEMITFRKSLMDAAAHDTRGPARVVIAAAKPGIGQSLRFTRLNELFELFADVESARAALKG